MPRYFFDTCDGGVIESDQDGVELPDATAAHVAALAAIPGVIGDTLPRSDIRELSISIRDENGANLYTATLTLRGVWTNHQSAESATRVASG